MIWLNNCFAVGFEIELKVSDNTDSGCEDSGCEYASVSMRICSRFYVGGANMF